MMVSDREPSARVVSPAPISALAPIRLSTPTMRKFSSPSWALGSRMSLEPGSSAAMVLSSLFLAVCHCHAAPVTASAQPAMSAAAVRPRISAPRRRPSWTAAGAGSGVPGPGTGPGTGPGIGPVALSIAALAAAVSARSASSALRRVSGVICSLPVRRAISSEAAMPSRWFPEDLGGVRSQGALIEPARGGRLPSESGDCWPGVTSSPSLMFQEASGSVSSRVSMRYAVPVCRHPVGT